MTEMRHFYLKIECCFLTSSFFYRPFKRTLVTNGLNVTFCLFQVAIFLSETLMQSFTVCVILVLVLTFFSFYLFLSVYFFLLFFYSFRFYLCTVCTIFIIIMYQHKPFLMKHVMMSSDQCSSLCYSTNQK